jgi:spore germination cell wall hydrolase CwlJ-like protein
LNLNTDTLYPIFLTALCTWREARGESSEAQRGVIWTIANRVEQGGWFGKDAVSVVLKPFQFSSFNESDPNAVKFPSATDSIFKDILLMVMDQGLDEDPTDGATHYFSGDDAPSWAAEMTFTTQIGAFKFFRR